jgi:2-iminoacetate synthase
MQMTVAEAQKIRGAVHGNGLTLHSVIYPLDYCTSGCSYCGLSTLLAKEGAHGVRGGMPPETFDSVLRGLGAMGYQVHELVFGTVAEDQRRLAERIARWVDRARKVTADAYLIVNCDTLQPDGYRLLKDAGVDAVWTFMELMTPELYRQKHRSGIKADQAQRLEAPQRIRDAGMAVGNALLWGLATDWEAELSQFVQFAEEVGGFDFVATPVQQDITLPQGTAAPAGFDVEPPLRVSPKLYLEIVSRLRIAFPDTRLVANTRLNPDYVYGNVSTVADMCNGYVWTGSRSHPKGALAEPGYVASDETQMNFFNPGADPRGIQALCPEDIEVRLELNRDALAL